MHALSLGMWLLVGGLSDPPRPGVGDAAPPLELATLDGRPFARADLSGAGRGKPGDVTVVDFFATWCKPCHAALLDLVALRRALGARVRVVLVDVSEDPATVRRFLAATALPEGAEVALDINGVTARRWGHERFPTAFVVDGAGIIRHINRGWGPGYQARMLRWLRTMLPEARSSTGPPSPPPQ